jgi:hypothetical protein
MTGSNKKIILLAAALLLRGDLLAQKPIRVGTTAAEFLSIGYGSAGCAMGDAYVGVVDDISGVYWNPAGLSAMQGSQAMFSYQPWVADINTFFLSAGINVPTMGVIAVSAFGVNYGNMDVTTVEDQSGTGETFSPKDYAFVISYGRKLAQWFGFGASAKYITSQIWHESASAMAFDLGVRINTSFFAPSGNSDKGMTLGMCVSNYGTAMKYDGLDMLRSYDIEPSESGNYQDSKVKFEGERWELPLIFRIGVAFTPIELTHHSLTIAMDALHVNNNNETVNVGAQYTLNAPGFGKFHLRGGYRALFLEDSEFGATFGVGLVKQYMKNKSVMLDLTYRDVGIFGMFPAFSAAVAF